MGVIKYITPTTLSAAHSAASWTKRNISVNLIHRSKVKSSTTDLIMNIQGLYKVNTEPV